MRFLHLDLSQSWQKAFIAPTITPMAAPLAVVVAIESLPNLVGKSLGYIGLYLDRATTDAEQLAVLALLPQWAAPQFIRCSNLELTTWRVFCWQLGTSFKIAVASSW